MKYEAMKAYGGTKAWLHIFVTSVLMEVRSQLQASAALFPDTHRIVYQALDLVAKKDI
jgi:hypothetical protein